MNDLLLASIFDIECDLIVIPISTDGNVSNSFKKGLHYFDVPETFYEKKYKLGDIEIIPLPSQKENRFIAFACTVDHHNSAYYAIRSIGRKLAWSATKLGNIRVISTPVLGTGAGKLNHALSRRIMKSAFFEVVEVSNVKLMFCVQEEEDYKLLQSDRYYTEDCSGIQVLEAEIPNIKNSEIVERIQYDFEFYFSLAEQKFDEFIAYQSSPIFYDRLLSKFKTSSLAFGQFVKLAMGKEEEKFCTLCGELIAYIDHNAYYKNIWNKYPDKRILAKASVRQNDWFSNLIKFKQTGDLNSVSASIKNALIYLKSPESNLTMLSENHRKLVIDNIFPHLEYNRENLGKLFDFFDRKELIPQNLRNSGVLYSRILYLPFIKPIWNEVSSHNVSFEGNTEIDLSAVGKIIEECLRTNRKTLDLGNCGLTDLTVIPELFECTHIEELILSNEWAVFSEGKWRKTYSINSGKKNSIDSLPPEIVRLENLKILICGGDWKDYDTKEWNRWGIKSIAPLSKLEKLEYLNLSNSRLKSIKGLNKLKSLKIAHLNNNEISTSDGLENLIELKELYLSNNRIKNIDFLANLANIKTLDIHHNLIKDLTPLIGVIKKIGLTNSKWDQNVVNVAKNPLEQPPMAMVNLGTDAVLGLFEDIEKSGQYINKDIKIILVGNSEVGKSTLVKYLDNGTGLQDKHSATVWMDEKIIKSKYSIDAIGEECLLHVFDFGGHDYFHDTHHLFYTTNTIYILLWDQETNILKLRKTWQKTRNDEDIEIETQDYPLKYWLDSVKFHTRDVESNNFEPSIKREITYNSSLILIQNKVADASQVIFQNNGKFKEDYPFMYDMINLSIKSPRNMNHFDELFREMLNKMEIIGAILPKFYEPIKNSIEEYNEAPILTFSEFLDYCNHIIEDPIDEDQCRRMVRYLQQVGILLYSSRDLDEKIYIDKKWVIDSMHNILENLSRENGKFNRQYVVKVLGNDNRAVDDILLMMEEFKMIFKHPYSDHYIAPLYLPSIPGGKIGIFLNQNQQPWRRFEYKGYIHKNVILGIFQKFGSRIPKEKDSDTYSYWKDGLIIKDINSDDIIMIRFQLGNQDGNACIDVYELSKTDKKDFRNEVVKYIREVNDGYDLEEMVTLDGIDYISKGLLEKNAEIGKYIFSEKKLEDLKKSKVEEEKLFKLTDYLGFIDSPVKKKKVVISYSKKDLEHAYTLRRYLKPLIDADMIEEPWFCTHMNPGDDWDLKIKNKFDEADIIFFMVSEYFYSTNYIVDKEITTAVNRYKNDKNVKIIPIILEFYDWERKEPYNLKRFCALPLQGKPISSFDNPKIAWSTITAAVKRMIKKDLDPGNLEVIERELEEIYEKQVKGLLDRRVVNLTNQ